MPHIALFLPLAHGFHERVLLGIAAAARRTPSWVFHQFDQDADHLLALREWRPDGVITSGPGPAMAQELANLGVPVVNVSNAQEAPGLPFVVNDNAAIGAHGAAHFLERGYRHLAFLGWPGQGFSRERSTAFLAACRAAGAEATAYDPGPWGDRQAWYRNRSRSDRHLLGWLKALPRTCGVMAANDLLAWRAAELCRQDGIRIPEDLALLGTDDDQTICQLIQPALSSIQTDAQRIGREAAALLGRLMAGRPGETRLRIPPLGVAVRPSSDLFATSEPLVTRALAIIHEQADGDLDVATVVAGTGTSRRTLERRFQAVLRRSVLAEIQRERLARARTLLLTTDLSLTAIARRCGFASAAGLSRTFARREGISPRHLRQR